MNCKINLAELLRRCKANGPWSLNEFGHIRNHEGKCPLEVAAKVPMNSSELAKVELGIYGYSHTIYAADHRSFCDASGTERAHEIRRALLRELVGAK